MGKISEEKLPETLIEKERKEELTLLSITVGMGPETLKDFLNEINCSEAEYDGLLIKYKHVLKRYIEENSLKEVGQ